MSEAVWTPNFESADQRKAALQRLEDLRMKANGAAPAAPQQDAEPQIIMDSPMPPMMPVQPAPVKPVVVTTPKPADFEAEQTVLDALEVQAKEHLAQIQQRKEKLAEARRLRVDLKDGKVVIAKESGIVTLTLDEAKQLQKVLGETLKGKDDGVSLCQ